LNTLGRLRRRLLPIQAGVVTAFLLLPLWYRFSTRTSPPLGLAPLYVDYFLLLLPLLWTILWWLVLGLPGFRALLRDPLRRVWALLVMLLALWSYASLMWAFMRDLHPEVGATAALQFAVVLLFAVVIASAGPPPRAIIGALVVGLVFNAIITVLQAATQAPIGLRILGEFPSYAWSPGASVVVAPGWRWLRPSGLLPHPNALAGTLLAGVIAAALLVLTRRALIRWIGVIALPLGFGALLLTFSRAAWIGLAAAAFAVLPLVWTLIRRRFNSQLLLAILGVIAVTIAFVIPYRPLLGARVGEGEQSIELRSVSDRIVFTEFALRSIQETPILGIGIGNFPWRTSYMLVGTGYDLRGDNVHNVLLSAWAELGLIGLLLLMGALALGVEGTLRQIKANGIDLAPRIALLAIVIALLVVGQLDHYPWTLLNFQVLWWGCLATGMLPPTTQNNAESSVTNLS
jgi:O-antigen ligase